MVSVVTIEIFSGRENPSWELDDEQKAALRDLLQREREATLAKPTTILSRLGYRGVIVESDQEPLPLLLMAGGCVVEPSRFAPSLIDADQEIERFLLETGRPYLDPDLWALVEAGMAASRYTAPDAALLAPPPYNPRRWNNDPNTLRNNNCYNYGCDRITNTMAQPGVGSGARFTALRCDNVGPASQRDGLTPAAVVTGNPPANSHFVALVIAPGQDFHWYRFDASGRWSHKPGRTAATDVDNSGRVILNPEVADRGIYSQFCGYFTVDTTQLRIG